MRSPRLRPRQLRRPLRSRSRAARWRARRRRGRGRSSSKRRSTARGRRPGVRTRRSLTRRRRRGRAASRGQPTSVRDGSWPLPVCAWKRLLRRDSQPLALMILSALVDPPRRRQAALQELQTAAIRRVRPVPRSESSHAAVLSPPPRPQAHALPAPPTAAPATALISTPTSLQSRDARGHSARRAARPRLPSKASPPVHPSRFFPVGPSTVCRFGERRSPH